MIANEFAFLALGLVLGVASGAALVLVLGSHPTPREVRLTVSHDAVPRRGATLSSDAFITSSAEPARGGPADRRNLGRVDHPTGWSDSGGSPRRQLAPTQPLVGFAGRTSVSFGRSTMEPVAIAIEPERDPSLDAIRVQAVESAARLFRAELQTATAVREQPDPNPSLMQRSITTPASSAQDHDGSDLLPPERTDATPALTRILRGDHHALFAVVGALAGRDDSERRPWEDAVRSMTNALVAATIADGCLDFPVGNPFWDTFTVDQCRSIAGALAASGRRFDGIDGWAGERSPTYRDLTMAVAEVGLEPRRIRAWPTQDEIDDLYLEVTAAPDEYLATNAPDLSLEELQALVGMGGPERARLWAAWHRVRPILLGPIATD